MPPIYSANYDRILRLPDLTKLKVIGKGGKSITANVGDGPDLAMNTHEFILFAAARGGINA